MKISVVLTTRNDNFGGNMIEMGSACLQTMSRTFDEVILVDFGSKTPLYPIFNDIITEKNNNIRVISVPYEWVTNCIGDTVTMADVVARNIGIRRAYCDIIISSNIDIIPTSKNNLNFKDFNEDTFYTTGKYMVEQPMIAKLIAEGNSWEFIQNYLFDNKHSYYRQTEFHGDPWSVMSGCGDFQMGHKKIWFDDKVRGFEEIMIYKNHTDTNLQKKIIVNAQYKVVNASFIHIFHQSHASVLSRNVKLNNLHKTVHGFERTTNSENWGYPNETFEENII